jgi:molybdopterin synthase sulfur carrier subunit
MPVTIKIPAALRQFTEGHSESQLEARTVGQALAQLTCTYADLRPHLYRDENELRNFINVYVNDEDIRHQHRLDTPVNDGDIVTIVPSIAGGTSTLEQGRPENSSISSVDSALCSAESLTDGRRSFASKYLIRIKEIKSVRSAAAGSKTSPGWSQCLAGWGRR